MVTEKEILQGSGRRILSSEKIESRLEGLNEEWDRKEARKEL